MAIFNSYFDKNQRVIFWRENCYVDMFDNIKKTSQVLSRKISASASAATSRPKSLHSWSSWKKPWNVTPLCGVADYPRYEWIGLRENLQETMVFTIKYKGFLWIFPSSNSVTDMNEIWIRYFTWPILDFWVPYKIRNS